MNWKKVLAGCIVSVPFVTLLIAVFSGYQAAQILITLVVAVVFLGAFYWALQEIFE
jgi:hypothetical protein